MESRLRWRRKRIGGSLRFSTLPDTLPGVSRGVSEANVTSVVSSDAPSILDPFFDRPAGSCALSSLRRRRRKEERAAFDKVAILDLGLPTNHIRGK